MDETPDYSRYSRNELLDIAAHINREKFPERYAAVRQEIEAPKEQTQNCASATNEKRTFSVWDLFCGAVFGFVGGCLLVVWAINDMNRRGICPDASGLGILPLLTMVPGMVVWIPAASEVRRCWQKRRA